MHDIAKAIAGASQSNSEAIDFLQWKDGSGESLSTRIAQNGLDNIYRYSKNEREVAIRVGSIHSVKGETHTATLVLETYWFSHNLESIKDRLCADQKGCAGRGTRIQNRLKIHYVAMTRPSHLLCLAMKLAMFENGDGNLDQDLLQRAKQRGWQIELI